MPASINPATGERIAAYPKMPYTEVEDILEKTAGAAAEWGRVPPQERAGRAAAAAEALERQRDELALLVTREMGKPVSESRAEIEKCARVCRYYAENGPAFLADEPLDCDAAFSYAAFRPLGVVLAVMPWNFPFWQVFRFAAPALTAGNGGVLKHASNVSGCALAIESVMRESGYPEHLFRALITGGEEVARAIASPHVQAATLTGSEGAGSAVAAAAGKALKKTVLELGGSDPYLILEDADIGLAAEKCATSRMINGGQSCIAAKRFIVVDPVREAFTGKFLAEMGKFNPGDPEDPGTRLGPLAREDLRDEVHAQARRSVQAGARLLLGGSLPQGPGWYYPATVLDAVAPGMPAYSEEVFGPVAAIIHARDTDDAVRIANDSRFGLGAAVFTRDRELGRAVAARLQCGFCAVNDFVKSDPRLPFGGIKASGYGRELSRQGMREFVNIQTVAGL
jgi:succinate-semialdehyde dehydrogenase / glutarate-semialdehyde dehydrogenase